MQEVIASILDAENKADDILQQTIEKSKEIKRTADDDGEKIKSGAIAVFKVHRAAELNSAEKKAEAEYQLILAEGKNEAEKIAASASKSIDKLAEEIVSKITG